MALVQALSIPAECHHTPGLSGNPRPRPSAPHTPPNLPSTSNSQEAMGSVSSLIAQRPGPAHLVRHYRPVDVVPEPGATRLHRTTLGATSCLASFDTSQDPLLSSLTPSGNRKPLMVIGSSKDSGTNGNYSYLNQDYVGDWNDNTVHGSHGTGIDTGEAKDRQLGSLNGNVEEPPPKLVPVSGKLEKNMEKTVIRPTAFKPVVPKSHNSMQFLSPRHDRASLSDCQNNLNLLSPGSQMDTLPPCSENRNSYSGGRHTGGGSQTCSMSDSGRNSLTSLPPYGSIPCSLAPTDYPPGSAHLEPTKTAHGHSNSDSGCSSSSKSTGSVSGHGQPLSDSGSSERSPAPVEGGYEGVVRDLEDKLRERNVELQQLRDNLDENEVAICQVYEEKQKRCELELEELRQSCATRMQTQSQKAQRAQQVLQLQVFQLQQEKKLLQEDFGQLLQEREKLEERCTSYEKIQLGSRLEETKWEVCQKSGEISLLKQQMKDVQGELAQRMGEIVSLRGQLRDSLGELTTSQGLLQEANTAGHTRTMELEVCQNELQRRKSEAQLLRQKVGRLEEETARLRASATNQTSLQSPAHNGGGGRQCQAFPDGEEPHLTYESDEARAYESEALQSLRLQMDGLRAELVTERQRGEEQACSFEEEHRVWQEEKDKVIQYQKQLQQNYVGMYRRNRALERMLRKLSLELETRDELEEQDEGSGNEINFDEITATEI